MCEKTNERIATEIMEFKNACFQDEGHCNLFEYNENNLVVMKILYCGRKMGELLRRARKDDT